MLLFPAVFHARTVNVEGVFCQAVFDVFTLCNDRTNREFLSFRVGSFEKEM